MQVQTGDVIRGYDFKPMVGRGDCFVEGKVEVVNDNTNGYQAYKITVTRDFWDGSDAPRKGSRVGKTVFVPWKVSFMEYDGRVINLSRI
jgi:hypothetical protein